MVNVPSRTEVQSYEMALATPFKPKSISARIHPPLFIQNSGAWIELLSLAQSSGMASVVIRSIQNCEWRRQIPESISEMLIEQGDKYEFLRAVADSETNRAIQILLAEKIEVALINGMDMARRYYPTPQDRPVDSIDLLIHPKHKGAALRALGRAGFRTEDAGASHCAALRSNPRGTELKLYSGLMAIDSPDLLDEIWARTRDAVIPGVPLSTRCLSREDQIALLISEVLLDGTKLTLYLNDLHFLIQGGDLNWNEIISVLADRKKLFAAWFVLSILQQDYRTEIKPSVLACLSGVVNPLRKKSITRFLKNQELNTSQTIKLNDGLFERLKWGLSSTPTLSPK